MLLLSKEDIKSVITMKDMIEADKQAFKMVVDGTVDTPLRTVINGKYDGAFLFMPLPVFLHPALSRRSDPSSDSRKCLPAQSFYPDVFFPPAGLSIPPESRSIAVPLVPIGIPPGPGMISE